MLEVPSNKWIINHEITKKKWIVLPFIRELKKRSKNLDLQESKEYFMPKIAASQGKVPLDRTDRKLIKLLQRNGRLANADLAKEVNLTPTPCLRRIREMETSGLITGYRVSLNRRKAGFGVRVFLGVLRDRDVDRHQMWRHIELFPEIIGCYVVSGEFDLLLDVVAEDLDAYSNVLLEKIMKIPGVRQTRSMFVLREITSDAPIPLDALVAP